MADKLPTSPVRGTRDLLPAECALRDAALDVILRTYRSWGFQRIETPALEHLELLSSGQGGENEKLIFKIMKRGEKLDLSKPGLTEDDVADCGLRFDLTVPLARYYAEHQSELPLPFKAIQIGPVWRAERPQKGRYRQFTQCDIDVIGDASEQAEVELILATCAAFESVGWYGFRVRMNDRRLLNRFLDSCGIDDPLRKEAACAELDKLDKIGLPTVLERLSARGITAVELQRIEPLLVPGLTRGKWILKEFAEAIGAESEAESLRRIFSTLADHGTTAVFEPNLIRGMGYYTGPVFEIGIDGLPYSLAGGGRYDKMIGRLAGRDVPACGFSIGFERLLLVLQESGWIPEATARRIALVYDPDATQLSDALERAESIREDGAVVSIVALRHKKAGKQRADLEAQGFEIETLSTRGGGEA